ncbi:ABC transporter substrate-binding protein [Acetonema longum]|uniref:ABC transporter n=1 Tax=Acetonema longum DSM 6540 TaxID=1009370 RepID=F7NET7_9FIRM|nr:ABC transporter substrate-binding protein [Acetonema longum]EGO65498.1 ABC transporter [Acetonema longum DSM 6540]
MQKKILLPFYLFLCFLPALTAAGCSHPDAPSSPPLSAASNQADGYPVTIMNFDAAENPLAVTVKQPPGRVIITHPSATELLLELDLEDRIHSTVAPYGVPLARLQEKYSKVTVMQAPFVPSREEMLVAQPDLIIGWPHHFTDTILGEAATWHRRGVATYIMPNTLTKRQPTLENTVYACLDSVGRMFNIQEKTELYIKNLRQRVARVRQAVQNIPQRKTVLVVQNHLNGIFSLYDKSYLISHMIDTAGGINLCQNPAFLIGAEQVLAFDPDVIIYVSLSRQGLVSNLTEAEALAELGEINELQNMRAIREGRIISLPFFTVNNGGVRTVDTIEKIARALYPHISF